MSTTFRKNLIGGATRQLWVVPAGKKREVLGGFASGNNKAPTGISLLMVTAAGVSYGLVEGVKPNAASWSNQLTIAAPVCVAAGDQLQAFGFPADLNYDLFVTYVEVDVSG